MTANEAVTLLLLEAAAEWIRAGGHAPQDWTQLESQDFLSEAQRALVAVSQAIGTKGQW